MLLDRRGDKHAIKAYQIDDICGEIKEMRIDEYVHLFPSLSLKDVERRGGKVDLLIGNNYAPLHPRRINICEGLALYESQFGTVRILGGSHQGKHEMNHMSHAVRHYVNAQMCNVRVTKIRNEQNCCMSEDFEKESKMGLTVLLVMI